MSHWGVAIERKLLVIVGAFLIVSGLLFLVVTAVVATGGPHEGTFTLTTDSCAGCHRTHTGTSGKILNASNQFNLCVSCHDGSAASPQVTFRDLYLSLNSINLSQGGIFLFVKPKVTK